MSHSRSSATKLGTPVRVPIIQHNTNTTTSSSSSSSSSAAPARPRASPTSSKPSTSSSSSSSPFRSSTRAAPSASPLRVSAHQLPAAGLPTASPPRTTPISPPKSKMISRQRYDAQPKQDPFATKRKFKTPFSSAYASGRLPFRLLHGSVHHSLQWDAPIPECDIESFIPLLAEGLSETDHPYHLMARCAWKETMSCITPDRLAPLLQQVIQPLRAALLNSDMSIYENAINAIIQLSNNVKHALNPYIHLLIQQIYKKTFVKKHNLADLTQQCMNALAENGGDEAIAIIKQKAPTFCT